MSADTSLYGLKCLREPRTGNISDLVRMIQADWKDILLPSLPPDLDQITDAELDGAVQTIAYNTKTERNALFAKFGLETWNIVNNLRADAATQGDGIDVWKVSKVDDQIVPEPLTTSDLGTQPIDNLKIATMQTVREAVRLWDMQTSVGAQENPEDTRNNAYLWLNHLYELHQQLTGKEKGKDMQPAAQILATGYVTGAMVMWNALKVIPEVFKKAKGRAITKDELDSLTQPRNIEPLFLHLAAGGQTLVINFIQALCDAPVRANLDPKLFFNPDYFSLVPVLNGKTVADGTEGAQEILTINHDFVDKFMREKGDIIVEAMDPDYFVTGCPAIFVQLIQTMYEDWVLPLAQKYYFPTVVQSGQ